MTPNRKDQLRKLLKGIETGDPESVTVLNEDKYIQHNPCLNCFESLELAAVQPFLQQYYSRLVSWFLL